MKVNSKKRLIIIGCLVIIGFFSFFKNLEPFYKMYIELFHKNATISHHNKQGKLDGEYIAYISGKIYGKSYFKDGLREGWCVWYDEKTWKKKDEVFYKHGKADGIENVYYENGNLNYSTNWRNGRYCKSEYHYLDNGKLNTYNAFDESKNANNGYCYVAYDETGKFHQILGDVFSSYIYSTCKDSTVALMDNTNYNCIKDLYISIATPPQLTPWMEIFVNNIRFKVTIHHNTIVVPNVFKKSGSYQILIIGKLTNTAGRTAKADTLKATIIKQ